MRPVTAWAQKLTHENCFITYRRRLQPGHDLTLQSATRNPSRQRQHVRSAQFAAARRDFAEHLLPSAGGTAARREREDGLNLYQSRAKGRNLSLFVAFESCGQLSLRERKPAFSLKLYFCCGSDRVRWPDNKRAGP